MGAEDRVCFQRAGRAIAQRFSLEDWVMSGFYLDREMIEGAGADPEEVEAALARELEGCAIVERVWTRAELMNTRMDEPDRDASSLSPQLPRGAEPGPSGAADSPRHAPAGASWPPTAHPTNTTPTCPCSSSCLVFPGVALLNPSVS